jgi:hypothetical protein
LRNLRAKDSSFVHVQGESKQSNIK